MRTFTTEDISGAGQYLIRNDKEPGKFVDPGFMSTIMLKVGYIYGNKHVGFQDSKYTLTDMSDGWTRLGYFITKDDEGNQIEDSDKWGFKTFTEPQDLVDYLNNESLSQEYRFATQEEVVRVVMYQKSRWK